MNLFFIKYIKATALLFGCAVLFVGCEEDLAKKNAKNTKKNIPSQIIYNAKIVQRDSGQIKIRASAALIEKYELIDTPFIEAKKGIKIEFFDKKKPDSAGIITADYAKITEMKKFYEAKGNVKIRTVEGEIFAMNSIFWDQNKKEIYTRDTVHITRKDGTMLVAKNGMNAKDDFSEYHFYNNSGRVPIKQKDIAPNKR